MPYFYPIFTQKWGIFEVPILGFGWGVSGVFLLAESIGHGFGALRPSFDAEI